MIVPLPIITHTSGSDTSCAAMPLWAWIILGAISVIALTSLTVMGVAAIRYCCFDKDSDKVLNWGFAGVVVSLLLLFLFAIVIMIYSAVTGGGSSV